MAKLSNVQLLRAVAALGVVFYHSGLESTRLCTTLGSNCDAPYGPLRFGYAGVGLFFMISGFIMVVTSWESFAKPGAPLDFMHRRAQRIVPLYWLITTIAVVGVWFVPQMLNVEVMDRAYIVASYLFWPMSRPNGDVWPIANLGWTLNLEMMFYLVFAASLLFSRARGMFYAVSFLSLLTLLQMAGTFAPGGRLPFTPLNFWGDPLIILFMVGMGIGVLYRRGLRLSRSETILLLASAFILQMSVGTWEYMVADLPKNSFFSRLVDAPPMLALLVAGALGPQIKTESLFWRAGLLIGDASYSLYLIHPFVLRSANKLWPKLVGTHLPVWCFTIVAISAAITAGLLLYLVFERPLNQYFARKNRAEKAKPVRVAHA